MDRFPGCDHDPAGSTIFLYHGTNCYRRWEINRAANITPGRSGYSFFSLSAQDAFCYARAASLRDTGSGAGNSLVGEPVVLKVGFNERLWMQADFVQASTGGSSDEPEVTIAVLGPVPSSAIAAVSHCHHVRAEGLTGRRSFADGSLRSGTVRLRRKTARFRLDAFLLRGFCQLFRSGMLWLSGKRTPTLTVGDELRRLARVQARL